MSDITKHEWLDDDFLSARGEDGLIIIDMPCGGGHVALNKSDAIAIAKHFGLIDKQHNIESETNYLLEGVNGERLKESIAQLGAGQ